MDEESHKKGTGTESSPKPGSKPETLILARQIQEDELSYRRTHRWNIFSWASGLLLGGIGGLFALSRLTGAASQASFARKQKFALIAAIFIFSAYSWFWLHYHYKREQCAKTNLARIHKKLLANLKKPKLTKPSADWPACLSRRPSGLSKKLPLLSVTFKNTSFDEITVILLGIVAIVAAWLI